MPVRDGGDEVRVRAGEVVGEVPLAGVEEVDGEGRRADEGVVGDARVADANEHQRGLQREEENAVAAIPTPSPSPGAVTTATPLAHRDMASRNCSTGTPRGAAEGSLGGFPDTAGP